MYRERRAMEISWLRTIQSTLMPTPFPALRLLICNVASFTKIETLLDLLEILETQTAFNRF